ncbi:MAG: threonylcarbamoyl-AMP synthase, partial [Nonlabens sp.]
MAQLIKIYEDNPNQRELERIVKAMRAGALVIYPTDTV